MFNQCRCCGAKKFALALRNHLTEIFTTAKTGCVHARFITRARSLFNRTQLSYHVFFSLVIILEGSWRPRSLEPSSTQADSCAFSSGSAFSQPGSQNIQPGQGPAPVLLFQALSCLVRPKSLRHHYDSDQNAESVADN